MSMWTKKLAVINDAAITVHDGIGLEDVAAFCIAVTAICTFLWKILQPVIEQSKRWDQFWEDWAGTEESPGRDAVPGVMERLQRIDGELQRNGGGSLKDMVVQNSERLVRIEQEHVEILKTISKEPSNEK